MVRRFTRVKTSEGGAMREESTGAFVLHGDYVKLKTRHDELLEALTVTLDEIGHWLSQQKPELREKLVSTINKATGEER